MDKFADGVFYLKLGQVFVAIVCLVSGFICCLCGWGLCSRTRKKFKRTQLVSPQHDYDLRLEVRKQVLVEEGLAAVWFWSMVKHERMRTTWRLAIDLERPLEPSRRRC